MSFVAAGTFIVGDVAAASMGALATGMIGGALVGAGTGALVNGLTGRSVLNGALMGGAIGAGGGALGGYMAGAEATGMIGTDIVAMQEAGATTAEINTALQGTYGMTEAQANAAMLQASSGTASGINMTAANAADAANGVTSNIAAGSTPTGNSLSAANTVKQSANAAQNQPTTQPSVPTSQYSGSGLIPNNVMPWNGEGLNPALPSTNYSGTGLDPAFNQVTNASNVYQNGVQTPNAISGFFDKAGNWVSQNKGLTAAGLGAAYLATRPNAFKANYLPTYTPPSAQSYGLGRTMSSNYRPTFAAAEGGIARLATGGPTTDFMSTGGAYPMSQQDTPHYATPSQMPTSAQAAMASYEPNTNPLTGEQTGFANGGITRLAAGGAPAPIATSTAPTINTPIQTVAGLTGLQQAQKQSQAQPITMDYINSLASQYGVSIPTVGVKSAAKGGSMGGEYNLGSYSDGGRLLKGPGDGMSDNIPASIADKQPARLADGEFVVSADVVSGLGNGSTDAGAKHLYRMMDNVRKARTGRKSQGKQIKADKYLPK